MSQEELHEIACPVRCPENYAFNGLYDAEREGGVIYLWEGVARGPYLDHVIVHEMIHYLQHVKGERPWGCDSERRAHYFSDKYMLSRGQRPPPRFSVC